VLFQAAEHRTVREDLHSRLTKAQRDARALHAGYRALRHRFEDVAPTDTALNGGSDGDDSIQRLHVPHEDTMCLGGAPPTPAEAREMDTRGLAGPHISFPTSTERCSSAR